jgi:hypothetical protein
MVDLPKSRHEASSLIDSGDDGDHSEDGDEHSRRTCSLARPDLKRG